MARIGFVGLGNMGGPMAANLVKAGHEVRGLDLSEEARARLAEAGGTPVTSIKDMASEADVIVTMLPAGAHVRKVYGDDDGIFAHARSGTLLIDSSTIDVDSARPSPRAQGRRACPWSMRRFPAEWAEPPPAP